MSYLQMTEIIEVTDLSGDGVSVFSKLTEAQLRNRLEPEKGIFIAESPKVIDLALNEGYIPVSLLMEPKHIEGQGKEIIERCSDTASYGDVPVYTAERKILAQLAGFELTRGVLCAMRRPKLPTASPFWKVLWTPPTSAQYSVRRRLLIWTQCL